jgi:hypothetical protein
MPNENGPGALAGAAEAGLRDSVDARSDTPIPGSVPAPDTAEAAREYHRRGLRVVPVPAGQKAAVMAGWPEFRATADNLPRLFGHGENIGVIFGPPSGEMVDIDLDCAEALALADLYLPPTRAEFGRLSKPRSHRLYIAPGACYESFADPLCDRKNTIVELRAAGRDGGAHQTIFPPSVADGERREWHGDTIEPAVIEAVVLRTTVAWLAIGSLVMRYIGEIPARDPGPDLPRLLWEADPALGRRAFDWLGRPHPDAPRRYPRPRRELSPDDLNFAEMVAAIINNFDWHEWNAVGMAIYAASGGSEDGFVAFDDLSARSPKYKPHTVVERWRNYHHSPPNRTGIGKLIALALAAGWRPPERREAAP